MDNDMYHVTYADPHALICTIAATMLKLDSEPSYVDAAIEMAFKIDAKVRERFTNGQ